MNILVTGGTGALGREVVKKLRAAGHTARVLSRKPSTERDWAQGDIATGAGLAEAMIGIDAVVHAATAALQPWKLRSTDVVGTRRVLAMARAARPGRRSRPTTTMADLCVSMSRLSSAPPSARIPTAS